MKILVVGSGGREHTIVRTLKQSKKISGIIAAPGNGGIAADAECFDIAATDIDGMVALAQNQSVDTVFVAPDDPLAMGMVDRLNACGIRAFGPDAAAARIESSKVFSKQLMEKYNIPTARFRDFSSAGRAIAYVKEQNKFPVVIKADGLALGKGVIICNDLAEAEQGINQIMCERTFGSSGDCIVVEEFITGPEVSVLAFADGKTVVPMLSSMDHKRIFDGNKGPNTGGMGTICPNPHYTDEMAERCMNEIFIPTMKAMQAEGCPFKGCLYFGLMLTEDGPMVIEYNARFGDPETQVVLPLLKTDLSDILDACIDGKLDDIEIEWADGAAACVVLASGGYPGNYQKGIEINGLNSSGQLDSGAATVIHAGTGKTSERFKTAGGRVLGICATGNNLNSALSSAYNAIDEIQFNGMQYRKDIGKY